MMEKSTSGDVEESSQVKNEGPKIKDEEWTSVKKTQRSLSRNTLPSASRTKRKPKTPSACASKASVRRVMNPDVEIIEKRLKQPTITSFFKKRQHSNNNNIVKVEEAEIKPHTNENNIKRTSTEMLLISNNKKSRTDESSSSSVEEILLISPPPSPEIQLEIKTEELIIDDDFVDNDLVTNSPCLTEHNKELSNNSLVSNSLQVPSEEICDLHNVPLYDRKIPAVTLSVIEPNLETNAHANNYHYNKLKTETFSPVKVPEKTNVDRMNSSENSSEVQSAVQAFEQNNNNYRSEMKSNSMTLMPIDEISLISLPSSPKIQPEIKIEVINLDDDFIDNDLATNPHSLTENNRKLLKNPLISNSLQFPSGELNLLRKVSLNDYDIPAVPQNMDVDQTNSTENSSKVQSNAQNNNVHRSEITSDVMTVLSADAELLLTHSPEFESPIKKIQDKTFRTPDKNLPSTSGLHLSSKLLVSSKSPTKKSNIISSPEQTSPLSLTSNSVFQSPKTPKKIPSSFKLRTEISPKKNLTETFNKSKLHETIKNLNLYKQGAIKKNNFDLHEIYASGKFEFQYGSLDTAASMKFDLNDVKIPTLRYHKDVKKLFSLITDVFSNPINSGYFDEEEINMIFSILTLSIESQMLMTKLLQKKICWMSRQELMNNENRQCQLDMLLKELTDRRFLISNHEEIETVVISNYLSKEDLITLCKAMKIAHNVSKEKMIVALMGLAQNTISPSRKMKSPSDELQEHIKKIEKFFKISDETVKLVLRIITLHYPTLDVKKNLLSTFFSLNNDEKLYPIIMEPKFPIFKDRTHVIDVIEAKTGLSEIMQKISPDDSGKIDWGIIRNLGQTAYDNLNSFFEAESQEVLLQVGEFELPNHIKKFTPVYFWGEALFASIEAFKKLQDKGVKTIELLEFLIDNRLKIPGKFVDWYKSLIDIEINRHNNLERGAYWLLEILGQHKTLTPEDYFELIERAKKLSSKSKELPQRIKDELKIYIFPCYSNKKEEIVFEVDLMEEQNGGKSTWKINNGIESKVFEDTKDIAIHYYLNNFEKGVYCDDSLMITLCACLYWEEIYSPSVPGAFVCRYQKAPLDYDHPDFFKNRQNIIFKKYHEIMKLNENKFCDKMFNNYVNYKDFECLVSKFGNDPNDFKHLIRCLGSDRVKKICGDIVTKGFQLPSTGMPNLFMFNVNDSQCKFIFVKKFGESLSLQNRVFIRQFEAINVPVEVFFVKPKIANNQ